MPNGTMWRRVLSLAFAVVAIWRLWESFGMAVIASSVPLVGLLALVGQGLAALIAAIALWNEMRSLGRAALVAFVLFVGVQMAADTFGYGIRSLFEALASILAALLLAGLGWFALANRAYGERGSSPIGNEG
jgi:hypothetical protein